MRAATPGHSFGKAWLRVPELGFGVDLPLTSFPPATPVETPSARTPTPTAARVFDRYFSSSQPTPSPTPL